MENNIENIVINEENTISDENVSTDEMSENITIEERTTEYISSDYSKNLDLIHQDLGFICSILIIFILVILLKYAYKFLDMFF